MLFAGSGLIPIALIRLLGYKLRYKTRIAPLSEGRLEPAEELFYQTQ